MRVYQFRHVGTAAFLLPHRHDAKEREYSGTIFKVNQPNAKNPFIIFTGGVNLPRYSVTLDTVPTTIDDIRF